MVIIMRTLLNVSLSLIASLMVTSVHAHAVNLVTENYPPFTYANSVNGDAEGVSVAEVREVMRRAKENYSVQVFPWSRALQTVQTDRDSCVFLTARTPEREAKFKWVGPLMHNNMMVFGRADDPNRPHSLDGMRSKVIGTKRADANSEFLLAHGFTIEPANVDMLNPRKLLAKRFDYWATSEAMGEDILKKQGLSGEISPLFVYQQLDMYLACSIDMDQAKINRWNRILHQMEAEAPKGKH